MQVFEGEKTHSKYYPAGCLVKCYLMGSVLWSPCKPLSLENRNHQLDRGCVCWREEGSSSIQLKNYYLQNVAKIPQNPASDKVNVSRNNQPSNRYCWEASCWGLHQPWKMGLLSLNTTLSTVKAQIVRVKFVAGKRVSRKIPVWKCDLCQWLCMVTSAPGSKLHLCSPYVKYRSHLSVVYLQDRS